MYAKEFQEKMLAALETVSKDKAGFYKAEALREWEIPANTDRDAVRSYRNRCRVQDKETKEVSLREGYNPKMQALLKGLTAEGVEIVLEKVDAFLATKATSASKVASLEEQVRLLSEQVRLLQEQKA